MEANLQSAGRPDNNSAPRSAELSKEGPTRAAALVQCCGADKGTLCGLK